VFGSYELSNFSANIGEISIRFEKNGNFYRYVREDKNKIEKDIFTESGRVIVNPVEPVNLPKEITNFLQIEFKKPFFSEPKSSVEVYITFPIEIAVFIAAKKSVGAIDIFSLQNPKYTLYGDPRTGIICRYWKSEIYTDIPEVDMYREGIMKLRITNSHDEWVEINSVVLDIYGMKIYYGEEIVYSAASMNVTSQKIAETRFIEKPLRTNMKRALELYVAKRIVVKRNKFVMEWGL